MALSALSALLTLGGCRPGPGARPGSQRAPQSQGGRPPGDIAFRLVVALAHATVDGADGASVTFSRLGQPTTLAASDDVVTAMDADQDATGEGPYVDTARTGERCHAAAPRPSAASRRPHPGRSLSPVFRTGRKVRGDPWLNCLRGQKNGVKFDLRKRARYQAGSGRSGRSSA
jgi:hypothetical protein